MVFAEYLRNKDVQKAAKAYANKHEGRFFGAEPGFLLIYETEDGERAYSCPVEADAAQVLKDLQSGRPMSELWPELVYDPDCAY